MNSFSLRESMGISAEESVRAFKEPHVLALIERPRIVLPRIHSVITSIDPSGGGASAFAICSIARMTDGSVVVRCFQPTPTVTHTP